MRKIIFIVLSFLCLPVLGNAQISITLQNIPFTILSNNNEVTMAGSVLSGYYESDYGLNLENNPSNDGSFSQPEFLILYDFLTKKNRDKESMLLLYDAESREKANENIDIFEASKAYEDFLNFKLMSKFVYGDNVRIRYDFITNTGETYPWVQMIKRVGTRYYMTESIPISNLLIQLGSSSPLNYKGESFSPSNVSSLNVLKFISDSVSSKLNNTYRGNDFTDVYVSIEKIDSNYSGSETELLNQMFYALKNDDKDLFISLWDPEEVSKFQFTPEFKSQLEIMMDLYKEIVVYSSVGILRADNECVLFYNCTMSDDTKGLLMFPLILKDGKFYLEPALKHYYAWTLLNTDIIAQQINIILNKF